MVAVSETVPEPEKLEGYAGETLRTRTAGVIAAAGAFGT
jgi:hypothetical protein